MYILQFETEMRVPTHYKISKGVTLSFLKKAFKCFHYLHLNQTTSEVTFPDSPKGQFYS